MTPVVDAHVHVVSRDEARYPLRPSGIGTDWYRRAPVDVDGLRAVMAAAGVEGAVLVQAFGAYSTDNSYVLDAASSAGFPAVVIPESAAELRRLVAHGGARGVRLLAVGDGGTLDDDGVWSAAVDLDIPVVVATLPDGLPALAAMLSRHPDAVVALDHCGFAPAGDVVALAGFANLHLKVTPHVLSTRYVETVAAAFGPERLLFGSDFPQVHDRSYAELVALGRDACAGLDAHARAAFLGGNAQRLWPAAGDHDRSPP